MSRGTFAGVEDAAVERLFECSSDGWRLWLAARIHNATELNDGEMSDRSLLIIAVEAGLSIDEVRAAAADLVKRRAWQRTKSGWRNPHHSAHNDTRKRREVRRADWRRAKGLPPEYVPVENAPISAPENVAVPVENTAEFHAGKRPLPTLSSPLKSYQVKSSPVSAREQSLRRGDAAFTSHEDDGAGNADDERQLSKEAKATAKAIMEKVEAMKTRGSGRSQNAP